MNKKTVEVGFASKPAIFLEKSGAFSVLLRVKTSRKKDMMSRINEELESWLRGKTERRLEFRQGDQDLAIVVDVPEGIYNKQDVDNIAKVVLDALEGEEEPYLFKNDKQVARLLVYKRIRKEVEAYETQNFRQEFDTSQLHISFREHMPKEQMILRTKDPKAIGEKLI